MAKSIEKGVVLVIPANQSDDIFSDPQLVIAKDARIVAYPVQATPAEVESITRAAMQKREAS